MRQFKKMSQYQNLLFNKKNAFILFSLITYISILSYGKASKEESIFTPTEFETNFRYYYVTTALFSIFLINFFNFKIKDKITKIIFTFFFTLVIFGNIKNINKLGSDLSLASLPMKSFLVKNQIDQIGKTNSNEKSIYKIHKAWYNEEIPSLSIYKPFIYNANRCRIHKYEKNLKAKPTLAFSRTIFIPNDDFLNKIDVKNIHLNSKSFFKNNNPFNLLKDDETYWHVNHIPFPPSSIDLKINFKDDIKRKIIGISFKPRKDHGSQFWRNAVLMVKEQDNWIKISEINLDQAPNNDGITIRFDNKYSSLNYKLVFSGGFLNNSFYSFASLKLYESK
tara:strand:+ start:49 stop:1056 length:1008 start_codon:yes stop_codon:yes gene_type:complete